MVLYKYPVWTRFQLPLSPPDLGDKRIFDRQEFTVIDDLLYVLDLYGDWLEDLTYDHIKNLLRNGDVISAMTTLIQAIIDNVHEGYK